jgi:hypothetical protein
MVFLDTWALGQRANGGVSEIRWRGRSAPHCAPNCSQAALTGLVWRCNISRALGQRYRHAACDLQRLPSRSTPKQYVVHMDITNSYHHSRSDWSKTAETSYLMPSHRSTALPLGLPSNVSPAEVERPERLGGRAVLHCSKNHFQQSRCLFRCVDVRLCCCYLDGCHGRNRHCMTAVG